jgi:oligopeptide transport system ATP-binding protein
MAPLLEVENLKVYFHTREGVVRAVDGICYTVEAGETLGIVGESGSGKSVSCYSLLGLLPMPPARIESGRAKFGGDGNGGGIDLLACSPSERRSICGRRLSMIFQDPMTALNPYMRIGDQVMEPLLAHKLCDKTEAKQKAMQALDEVGIAGAKRLLGAWPHEFSGGMRQRVMIAMALITEPELLIADEPTTALDVTVQAQILRLIKHLQEKRTAKPEADPAPAPSPMAVILITHDLGVIAGMCDRVLVMYAGRIVESAETVELYRRPRHPYTEALLRAVPGAAETSGGEQPKSLYTIPGEPPDLARLPVGCAFAPRCEHATEVCRQERPELLEISPGHHSACLRVQQGEL